jgi:hypothetical protein
MHVLFVLVLYAPLVIKLGNLQIYIDSIYDYFSNYYACCELNENLRVIIEYLREIGTQFIFYKQRHGNLNENLRV